MNNDSVLAANQSASTFSATDLAVMTGSPLDLNLPRSASIYAIAADSSPDPTFLKASDLSTNLVKLIPGDFNGDRLTDFIRQETGELVDGNNDVMIYLSAGNGYFQAPIQMKNMGAMNGKYVNLIVGDFTGGGADDIIRQEKGVWVDGASDVQFYTFANGNFEFVSDVPDPAAMNGNFVNLVAGDFNGDRVTDLIRQEKGSWVDGNRDAEIYLSNGNWGFSSTRLMNDAAAMNGDYVNLIVGDFTGGGADDIIRQEKGAWVNGVNDVQFYTSENGNFKFVSDVPDAALMDGNFVNLIAGDFNGDRVTDLIRQEKGSRVNGDRDAEIYFSNGNWGFSSIRLMNDVEAMNGNFVDLIPGKFTPGPADDLIRHEFGSLVNGVNDDQMYTYKDGNLAFLSNLFSQNLPTPPIPPTPPTPPPAPPVSLGYGNSLTGLLGYTKGGEEKNATLRRIDGKDIENKKSWIVIHGWNDDSQGKLGALANAIDGYEDGDQVLTLDWSSASKTGSYNPITENDSFFASLKAASTWIVSTADFAVNSIKSWGIPASKVNVVGHSLGSFVSYEIAKGLKGISSLIALDPASQTAQGYNDEDVNFSNYSDWAWSFYGSLAGSSDRANTAEESFKFDFGGLDPNKHHGAVVKAFTGMLEKNNSGTNGNVSKLFNLDKMKSLNGEPWVRHDGFEAVLKPKETGNEWLPDLIDYYAGQNDETWWNPWDEKRVEIGE
jgi:pimeloyl-ACP methyl ester carboxylesterase